MIKVYLLICWLLSCSFAAPILYAQENESNAISEIADAAEKKDWRQVEQLVRDAEDSINLTQADGMTALHWACFHGNPKISSRLLEAGADPSAETEYLITPLSIVCESGHEEIAALLIKHGAKVDSKLSGGESPLMIAARTGNTEIVHALIDHGADVNKLENKGQSALMWAAAEGNTKVVDLLIKAGAKVNQKVWNGLDPLLFAARHGKIDACKRLIAAGADVHYAITKGGGERQPRKGMSALMFAVESAHFELAIELVELGADPNDLRSGYSPLHALTWVRKAKVGDNPEGDPEPRGSGSIHSLQFVREIVKRGADVDLQLKNGSSGPARLNLKGATPFLMAAKTADLPLLKVLLEQKADPTIPNVDGTTPILAASGLGVRSVGEEPGTLEEVKETIRFLIKLGADPNQIDKNGESVVHGAAYRSYPEEVAFLGTLGIDPNIWNRKNKWGKTPTNIAEGKRPGSFKPSPETIAAIQAIAQDN